MPQKQRALAAVNDEGGGGEVLAHGSRVRVWGVGRTVRSLLYYTSCEFYSLPPTPYPLFP